MTSQFQKDSLNCKEISEHEPTALKGVGLLLKQARETKSLSANDVAESLRIGEEQLIALENGEEDLLPEPVFIKAMVRRVAERLNLDPIPLLEKLQSKVIKYNEFPKKRNYRFSRINRIINYLGVKNLRSLSIVSVGIVGTIIAIRYIIKPSISSKVETPLEANSTPFISKINSNLIKEEEIKITSIKSTKIILINHKGEVLFKGVLRKTLSYPLGMGLDIYTDRPHLIKVTRQNKSTSRLGKINDSKWFNLKS